MSQPSIGGLSVGTCLFFVALSAALSGGEHSARTTQQPQRAKSPTTAPPSERPAHLDDHSRKQRASPAAQRGAKGRGAPRTDSQPARTVDLGGGLKITNVWGVNRPPRKDSTGRSAPPGISPLLKPGNDKSTSNQASEVEILQRLLNQRAQPPPNLTVNGIFDVDTRKAVIAFQKANHLRADGNVDTNTWQALLGLRVNSNVSTHVRPLVALRKILDDAGIETATVTSGDRTAYDQACPYGKHA